MIKYKKINEYIDMIIAISGSNYINYFLIFSYSTSPYLVSENKTFRDPTPSTSRKLYALYIIDKDNAVSLIYDTSPTGYTDLATINFATPSISYQRAFPLIYNLNSAIFVSPTVYYAGSYHSNFFTDSIKM
jgi:hypothetical protein